MYLHSTLYERAPQYWIFIGVLLVILGVYLGVEVSSTFLFTGVTLGLASCAWGVRVLVRRSRQSKDTDVTATSVRVD
ncbi:MAG: hypothetical protein GWP62_05495 [Gammaproteobacteria bacterium]|jgi:hypothetical protein|nr:hypothetical protein [Gammaproteobacteria bacterium]